MCTSFQQLYFAFRQLYFAFRQLRIAFRQLRIAFRQLRIAFRQPRPSEVPARHLPRLVWRGARNVTAAGREFVSSADLGKGLDPGQRAEIVQERRYEYATRVALVRRVIGYTVVAVWALAGVATVAVVEWSTPWAVAQVAVAVLIASPVVERGPRRSTYRRPRRRGPVEGRRGVEGRSQVPHPDGGLIVAQIAITWPVTMVVTSLALWTWAGPVYAWALAVGGFFLVFAAVVVLVAFAWRDGTLRDDLGLDHPAARPTR